VAPEGSYFTESKTGKTFELHETSEPQPFTIYPFGTTFYATSITAMEKQ